MRSLNLDDLGDDLTIFLQEEYSGTYVLVLDPSTAYIVQGISLFNEPAERTSCDRR